jgi:acetyltransferase-like isoleucine patch superfamily enzyme
MRKDMNEKEKMLGGNPYRADDLLLMKERTKVRKLIKRYNNSSPSQVRKRMKLLHRILGKHANKCVIHPPFYCDYGYNIEVGENFFANYNCILLDVNKIIIGNNVMLAPSVIITTAGHPIHPEARNSGLEYGKPIKIGNNVWIGANVVINPGVNIGDNVVIGSGSVVIHDIPDNTVCVGNPTKIVKQITESDKKFYYKKEKFDKTTQMAET